MSYIKRFLEDVMESMGEDEINDAVIAEAQRRMEQGKDRISSEEITDE